MSFTVSPVFTDNMVLQRDEPIRIWGNGTNEGETIYVAFRCKLTETTIQNGKWSIVLPEEQPFIRPEIMMIFTDKYHKIILKDIMVGDVWLLSGQSNMDHLMSYSASLYKQEISDAKVTDNIRLFRQDRWDAIANYSCMETPQENPINPTLCAWKDCTPERVSDFSAIGYLFAKEIIKSTAIPQGIIMVASGGAPLYELMNPELAKKLGYDKPVNNDIPVGGMYNALIAPVIGLAFKGLLFYQGESDVDRYKIYADHFKAFIEDLRERFALKNRNFPVYAVQLSTHQKDCWNGLVPALRCEQVKALQSVNNYKIVVSTDYGWQPGDIDVAHPLRKKPVAQRLAKLVLADHYAKGSIEYNSSPMPIRADFSKEGVLITFTYVGEGLQSRTNTQLIGFELIDADGNIHTAKSEIAGKNTILVTGIENPQAVRYAYFQFCPTDCATLVNSEDLPAPTFEFIKNDK